MNITHITSAENSCIGCGVCVSTCPTHHLQIEKNEYNQLYVIENNNKCFEKCSICLNVCPFSNESMNEDTWSNKLFHKTNQQYHNELGYYINCYVGFHPIEQRRLNSASGGLVSYLLEYLLENNIVDTVLVVGNKEKEPFFSYQLCHKSENVYNYSRSAYTIINITQALDLIIKNDSIQNVAIVALPCVSKALRNATKHNQKLKTKIKYIIGLVCGQQKSNNFIDYLALKNGISNLSKITFRVKKRGRTNGDYGVEMINSKGEKKEITFSDYAKEWSFKLFTVPACNFCDDIFAETADIVFMDAWLPEYRLSEKGENLIITRNQELDEIISNIKTIKPIKVNRIVESQSTVINNKKKGSWTAITLSNKELKYTPLKRTNRLIKPNFAERYLYKIKYNISMNADKLWIESGRNNNYFYTKMKRIYGYKVFWGLLLNKLGIIIKKIKNEK